MSRLLTLLYGSASYAIFLATFLYAMAFVAGVGVPKHIDNGASASLLAALAVDLALLTLFAVQHSGMARPAFKRWWTRFVPQAIERSTFVLVSSLVLLLLFWQWRPLPQVVWQLQPGWAEWSLMAVSLLGWLMVLTSSFTINHFELFGLRQVWLFVRGREAKDEPFVLRAMYRIVRHPLMLGFLIAFWATPSMTLGHLLFSGVVTGYIFVAVKFLEERDLVAAHGEAYREYQRTVPMLVPGIKRR
ncbi:methanethiol S-methyltransferase [Pseudoxanthomonas indica]|uniref:methanethiol S-methyltransferase n=1 Tax=Pseudoxanthomonas indica TaxID=428993 RepID=A0A1T5LRC4_9GAMM|nr:methanethiol S-methyltransferase [Pseudoxanthomonas indica]GGD38644.1 membrane protein [Pseudoxanthomonas indica]SKC78490.1 Protein-S-isoprenylcysteine O-methyltransferase Ste14 [Pseudoxanthomonas indica]